MVTTSPVPKALSGVILPVMANEELVQITCRNTCPKCGKVDAEDLEVMEWMARTMAHETHGLCSVCRAEADRKEMIAYQERHMAQLLNDADVPQEFRTWDKDLGNGVLAREIRDNRDRNLFICGENSKGKTRSAAYNLLLEVKAGKRCKYWRFSDLAAKYAAQCKADGDAQEWLKQQLKYDIIVMDDICKRRITDTAGEMLFDILDWLYGGDIHCRLWITANKDLAGVAQCFQNADTGDAVISRIDRMADACDGRMKIVVC